MAYSVKNFKTKKALKEAVASGERVEVFQPGMGTVPENGVAYLEGPHFPQAHAWYARVELVNGAVTKVK